MSSPDSIYFRNLIKLPEKKYKNCTTQTTISPSQYIEHYDGFGGSYTDMSVSKNFIISPKTKMGKLGYDRFEQIKTVNPYAVNSEEKFYLNIYKNGKKFAIKKGENILKQLAKLSK